MSRAGSVLIAVALLLAAGGSVRAQNPAASLKVYVAASTREAVERIAADFQRSTGFVVEISPGPSSKLAKQIVEGAPADIFLSADQANADYLAGKGLVAARRNLLGNRLVVVTPSNSTLSITKLADLGRDDVKEVALAIEKVPAGEYARQALRQAGVWERVAPKVIGGEDVRATLAFVERGATAGIVYRTDVVGNSSVRSVAEVESTLHRPIEYPLVLIQRPVMNPAAQQLYDFLASATAAAIFERVKFEVLR